MARLAQLDSSKTLYCGQESQPYDPGGHSCIQRLFLEKGKIVIDSQITCLCDTLNPAHGLCVPGIHFQKAPSRSLCWALFPPPLELGVCQVLFTAFFPSHSRTHPWVSLSFPKYTINSYGVVTPKSIPLLQVSLLSGRLIKHHYEQSWVMEREEILMTSKVKTLD